MALTNNDFRRLLNEADASVLAQPKQAKYIIYLFIYLFIYCLFVYLFICLFYLFI